MGFDDAAGRAQGQMRVANTMQHCYIAEGHCRQLIQVYNNLEVRPPDGDCWQSIVKGNQLN